MTIISGQGTLARAVEAGQAGAFFSLEKPVSHDGLMDLIHRAIEQLREGLYFRINTIALRVPPPLRECTENILQQCNHFLSKFNERYQKNVRSISAAAT